MEIAKGTDFAIIFAVFVPLPKTHRVSLNKMYIVYVYIYGRRRHAQYQTREDDEAAEDPKGKRKIEGGKIFERNAESRDAPIPRLAIDLVRDVDSVWVVAVRLGNFEESRDPPTWSMDGAGLLLVPPPKPRTRLPERETCVVNRDPALDQRREMCSRHPHCSKDRNGTCRFSIFGNWVLILTSGRKMWALVSLQTVAYAFVTAVAFVEEELSWGDGSRQQIGHQSADGLHR